jgi:hypothetical protein
MSNKSNFNLRKWYFDGISEDGRALICYSAVMSWRMLSVQYASYLYLDGNGKAHSESRYRDAPLPVIEGDDHPVGGYQTADPGGMAQRSGTRSAPGSTTAMRVIWTGAAAGRRPAVIFNCGISHPFPAMGTRNVWK